jgi:type I restriction enzyme S subunit
VTWRRVALKEVGAIVGGGTPSTKEPEYFGDDYPWITPKDLSRQRKRYIAEGERGISEAGLAASSAKVLPAGSIVISSRAPIGLTAIAQFPLTTNQGCRSFIPGDSTDSLFMYYLLGSMSAEFERLANGSTFKEISGSTLASIEIKLPSVAQQRGIAVALGALDDKIESNERAASLITQLISAEFQRASKVGHVKFVRLGEVASITKGVSYRSAELSESRTSLVTLKSFDRHGGYKSDGLKQYVGFYKPQQVIEAGEVVVAQTDLTQGAEVVGRAVRVPASATAEVLVASLDLVIVRPGKPITQEYLLGVLSDESFRQHCRSRTNGTTVLHLASDAITTYVFPLISEAVQRNFSNIIAPLVRRLDSLNVENVNTATLRDSLLPELLSGRISVPELEVVT